MSYFTYDNEGNLTRKVRKSDGQATDYTWDYRNRLTEVRIAAASGTTIADAVYAYDALDRRVETRSPGPAGTFNFDTLYDGDQPVADLNPADGSLLKFYIEGGRRRRFTWSDHLLFRLL